MATFYREVEVEVDLGEFDTEDLLKELKERESSLETSALILEIYEARQLGKDYQKLLDNLIYKSIGRIS